MGRPQQVVFERPTNQGIQCATYQGVQYVIYASGASVVIADAQLNPTQIIEDSQARASQSVCLDERSGLLAISFGRDLAIYQPENVDQKAMWQRIADLNVQDDVSILSWSEQGALLGAGNNISIWTRSGLMGDWNIVFSTVLASPIKKASFAAYGDQFATIAEYEPYVKVWIKTPEAWDYDYEYLLHPLPATHLEWGPARFSDNSWSNMLLTTSQDGVSRIWSCPTENYGCVMLGLSTTLHPEARSLHWLQAGRTNEDQKQGHISSLNVNFDKLPSAKVDLGVTAYSDLFFQIDAAGSLGILGLTASSNDGRHNYSRELKEISHALAASWVNDGSVVSVTRKSDGTTTMVLIAYLNYLGCLRVCQLETNQIPKRVISARFVAGPSVSGTHSPVACFERHSTLSYLAGLTADGQVMVLHHPEPETLASGSSSLIEIIGDMTPPSGEAYSYIKWTPSGPFIVVARGTSLEIYMVTNFNCTEVGRVNLPSKILSVKFLHIFSTTTDPTSTTWEIVVVGSDSAKVCGGTLDLLSPIGPAELSLHTTDTTLSDSSDSVYVALDGFEWGVEGCKLLAVECKSGKAKLWSLESKKNVWEATSHISMSPGVVRLVASSFGRVAAEIEDKALRRIDVYECEAPTSTCIKTGSLRLEGTGTHHITWLTSSGVDALVVACGTNVSLFSKHRTSSSSWDLLRDDEIVRHANVTSVTILRDATLVCGTDEKQILVMSDWTHGDTDHANVFTSIWNASGGLPQYHPHMLMQRMLWDEFDGVKEVVTHVHNIVSKFAETKTPLDVIPLSADFLEVSDRVTKSRRESVVPTSDYTSLLDTATVEDHDHPSTHSFDQMVRHLMELIQTTSLPDISNVDQMRLSAVLETLLEVERRNRALDANGVRFVLGFRLFTFLSKMMPSVRQNELKSREFVWAFYSDSQDVLVDYVSQTMGGKLLWHDFKTLGMGYWVRNIELLRRQIEILARNHYMAKDDKDPVDSAIFYIASRKKNVLLGLWKLASNHPEQAAMLRFLVNDFSEDRWQKAALKNAFALLGKQRYMYAAAFFLLGDKLKDAVNVCLKHLDDPQLAIILCRLYEGDESATLKDVITTHLLPKAYQTSDRWVISMCMTTLGRKADAFKAVCVPLKELDPSVTIEDDATHDASIVALHQHLKSSYRLSRIPIPDVSPKVEADFIGRAALAYEQSGCPSLALRIMMHNSHVLIAGQEQPSVAAPATTKTATPDVKAPVKAESIDWSQPSVPTSKTSESASAFDWSQPSAQAPSPPASSSSYLDWGEATPKVSVDDDYDAFRKSMITEDTNEEEVVEEDLEGSESASLKKEDSSHSIGGPVSSASLVSHYKLFMWRLVLQMSRHVYKSTSMLVIHSDLVSLDPTILRANFLNLLSLMEIPSSLQLTFVKEQCHELLSSLAFISLKVDDGIDDGQVVLRKNVLSLLCAQKAHFQHILKNQYLAFKMNMPCINDALWSISEFVDIASTSPDPEKASLRQSVFEIGATTLIAFIATAMNGNMNPASCVKDFIPFLKACARLDGDEIRRVLGKTRNIRPILEVTNGDDMADHDTVVIHTSLQHHLGVLAILQALVFALNTFGASEASSTVLSTTNLIFEMMKDEASKTKQEASLGVFKIPNADGLRSCVNENRAGEVVDSINSLIETERLKSFWDGIFSLVVIEVKPTPAIAAIVASSPDIKRSASVDAVSAIGAIRNTSDKEEVIYRSEGASSGFFAMNSLDGNQVAVATLVNILEVDVGMAVKSRKTTISRSKSHDAVPSLARNKSASAAPSRSNQDDGVVLRRAIGGVVGTDYHPSLDFYIAGTHDAIHLLQFSNPETVASYATSSTSQVTNQNVKVRFAPSGNRFAAIDTGGELRIWDVHSRTPIQVLKCFPESGTDVSFIASGSLIALAGLDLHNSSTIHLVDILMPPNQNIVKTFSCHDSPVFSLSHSLTTNLLLGGGKRGDVSLYDLRSKQAYGNIRVFDASHAIKSMDTANHTRDFERIVCGSSQGDLVLFNNISALAQESTNVGSSGAMPVAENGVRIHPSSIMNGGISQLAVMNEYLFWSGGDGSIRRQHIGRTGASSPENRRAKIYVSGATVVIADAQLNPTQIIEDSQARASQSVCLDDERSGLLAISFGRDLAIYQPENVDQKAMWQRIADLNVQDDVSILSWSEQGALLGAGNSISIWTRSGLMGDWNIVFSTVLASPIKKASFCCIWRSVTTIGEPSKAIAQIALDTNATILPDSRAPKGHFAFVALSPDTPPFESVAYAQLAMVSWIYVMVRASQKREY
ncbi:hypothetical protein SmJEL517_g05345 [Synchytrium microbalum]|uniref:RAVE complex protein Rav1 C-terminal domain-containing protein n=1 Tax=Synchytrium microbalum TaxID=1806994 RepID=A0A507BLY5_9FUNG|nr:uncharacterized protein SmJEL517_g05345 [Synchytrium microbalum]TPX31320.1 hypothetical protein SmJEL517_g05345 [Synchytrium microbalum]